MLTLKTNNVFSGSKRIWSKVSDMISVLVREDALKGIMQNDTQNHKYLSEKYKRYKNNDMRRFTTGAPSSSGNYFDNPKAGYNPKTNQGTGDRLKAYKGRAIVSNTTTYVDMTLTQDLFNGLKGTPDDNGTTMKFGVGSKDGLAKTKGKILGNAKLGREVRGLNSKNKQIVKEYVQTELLKVIKGNLVPNIEIEVRF